MLLAALAFALATGDVVGELLRLPLPPPPPDPGLPPKCCECRSNPADLPKFAKSLASSDRARRTRAANQLAGILKYCYEPKAVVLLTPWISDPAWAEETSKGARMVVFEHAGWDQVAEAVPALTHAAQHDPSPEIRAAAAWSLALIRGDARPDPAVDFDRNDVAIGAVKAIDEERASAEAIAEAVRHHDQLCKRAAAELALLRSRGGVRAGIAAAITGDPKDRQAILAGEDAEAIRALQAASRFRTVP